VEPRRPETVLLVDDSPVARRALGRLLEAEGFRVREETSFCDAQEADASGLACAIIDLELLDGEGSELAAVLRARRSSLPIAFFTSGALPAILERARSQGPIFRKPDVEAVVAWAKQTAQPPPTK
jgi:CheY-like chemotaxis protein